MSKGSTQRPTDKQKFDDGWDRIFDKEKPVLLPHDCPVDGKLEVEKGKECNWCGKLVDTIT